MPDGYGMDSRPAFVRMAVRDMITGARTPGRPGTEESTGGNNPQANEEET
jgi:hypothetical protein